MGKGGVVFGIILIILGFGITPFMLDAFDSWRFTEAITLSVVTTGEGVTTGNVTLGNELYSANLDSVQRIASTNSDDTPAPSTYNEVTLALQVAGLEASESRSLTITYLTERTDSFLPNLAGVLPVLVVICMVGAGVGITVRSWRG